MRSRPAGVTAAASRHDRPPAHPCPPQRYPGVVAYVAGHLHANGVTPYFRADRRGGFWGLTTASSIDFPGQARLLQLMDNRDGTLSLFGTLVNQARRSPSAPGTPAGEMTDVQLASLARALAGNQTLRRFSHAGEKS